MHPLKVIVVTTMLLPTFAAAAQAAPPAHSPDTCRNDPNFRAQDFSVGSWDVYRANAKTAEVKMELILNECAIQQTWTVPTEKTTGNVSGLFSYSLIQKSWIYAFTTDYANNNYFLGEVVGPGQMRYETKVLQSDGGVRLRRWTLSLQSDGHISEKSVASTDGGKTWSDGYELIWIKRKS
jgi:hypothetical protein